MSSAVFGIIGVIVGAVVTGGVSLVLERSRERRQGEIGRRVAHAQLQEAGEAIAGALSHRKWPAGWETTTWSESWATFQAAVAVQLTDNAFETLARAYLYMRLLQTGFKAGVRDLTDADDQFFRNAEASVSQAVAVLGQRR